MNPFDFTGPAFLVFYIACGGAACGALHWLNRSREPQTPTTSVPTDAQTIAYLRGGPDEVLRIAALRLLEDGVLALGANDTLQLAALDRLPRDASPVDRAICDRFAGGGAASSLFDSDMIARAREHAAGALERAGLIPDSALREARMRALLTTAAALGAVAAIRIGVALQRGHSNIQLLLAAAAVFIFIAYRATVRHRTPAGDRALQYLTDTFEPLRQRTQEHARPASADVALVAAVFGLTALPAVPYASAPVLQPKAGSDGSGGGCGGDAGCGGCGCGG